LIVSFSAFVFILSIIKRQRKRKIRWPTAYSGNNKQFHFKTSMCSGIS